MHKLLIIFILSISIGTGCQNEQKISDRFTDQEIVLIFKDIYLAKAAANEVRKPMKDSLLNVYIEQISRMHNITPEEFQQLEIELSNDIERLEQIMIKVQNEFDKLNKIDESSIEK